MIFFRFLLQIIFFIFKQNLSNMKQSLIKIRILQVATGYLYSLLKLLFRCKMCRKMETLILHRFISLVKTWNNYCLIFPVLRKTECIEKKDA